MCWGIGVTTGMALVGAGGAVLTWRRGDARVIPATLAFFALMEVLQLAGYLVIDQCNSPVNQTITLLSVLHIMVQPVILNAFILQIARPDYSARGKVIVLGFAGLASAAMLVQLLPLAALGDCAPGVALCGARLCTVSGDWHLAWEVPYNGLLVPIETYLGTSFGFPSYALAVFVLPLFYGAWRFVLFHIVVGPLLSTHLTSNSNEAPAIWCLFSISIAAIALIPQVRRWFECQPTAAA
jgi:hypothetical protein